MEKGEKLLVNLNVLKRMDKQATNIIDTSSHVVVYDFNGKWSKRGIEGSLFLYQRASSPQYAFTIMNRLGIDNLEIYLTPDLEFSLQGDYVIFKDAQDEITGLWIYEVEDRTRLATKLTSLCIPQKAKSVVSQQQSQKQQSKKVEQSSTGDQEEIVDVLSMLHKAAAQAQKYNVNIPQTSPSPPRHAALPPPTSQFMNLGISPQQHHALPHQQFQNQTPPMHTMPQPPIPMQPPVNSLDDLFDRLDLCFVQNFGRRNLPHGEFHARAEILFKDKMLIDALYTKYNSRT